MVLGDTSWAHDVTPEEDPIFSHPLLIIQRGHKQLGQIDAANPKATHTRYEHSGLVLKITRAICDVLERKGRLEGSRNDIAVYARLHDLSHPAFSHAVEYILKELTGHTHKTRAATLLDSDVRDSHGRTLADVIRLCDGNVENVKQMMLGNNDMRWVVDHRTLGADKWAFTLMDAMQLQQPQMPPEWEALCPHIVLHNGNLGLDIRPRNGQKQSAESLIMAMQDFYFTMYTNVYLSRKSLVYERHVQRAVELALKAGVIEPEQLWTIDDGALVHTINERQARRGKRKILEQARRALAGYRLREPYTNVVAFKYQKYMKKFPEGDERVCAISYKYGQKFLEGFEDPRNLTKLEDTLEKRFGVPFLVSVLPEPRKLEARDVLLYSGANAVGTLKGEWPGHYTSLREKTRGFFAIRINVPTDEKAKIARQSDQVIKLFKEEAAKYMKAA